MSGMNLVFALVMVFAIGAVGGLVIGYVSGRAKAIEAEDQRNWERYSRRDESAL